MNGHNHFLLKISLLVLLAWLAAMPTQAKYLGADHNCCNDITLSSGGDNSSFVSLTEGNASVTYSSHSLSSAFGPTLNVNLTYNSYNADDSRAQIDAGLGYGWTHSYNQFLFSQRGSMFRMDGNGRVTRFRRSGRATYQTQIGYFETIERVANNFIISDTDGTQHEFAPIANSPFMVAGATWRLIRITEPDGDVTSLGYSNGDLVSLTDTFGRTINLGYNNHHLTSITDPLNRTTTLSYDPTWRKLVSIEDPDNKSVFYQYNSLYQLKGKTDKDGRDSTFVYLNNKPVGIVDGDDVAMFGLSNPVNWATNNNALRRLQLREFVPSTTTTNDGVGNNWQYEYDKHGYITKRIAPDGTTILFTYEPDVLQLSSQTDANGNTSSYEYDQHGNMLKQTDALGNVTTFTYALPAAFDVPIFDRLVSITDANGRVTDYEYDTKGNRTKENDPLGGVRSWSFNANGNVLTETDKNGHMAIHEYDTFGNRNVTTDAENNVTTMTYDAVGNLLTRTDANLHTISFEYDGLDRLVKEIDPAGNETEIAYDGVGNRILITDRNGNNSSFNYDIRQRLTKTTDALGQTETHSYDANDNRIASTDKNAHSSSFEYDVQNRPFKTTDAEGFVSSRTYDGVGNVLTETDANSHTTSHLYDALNRRIQSTDAIGCITQVEYDSTDLAGCPECTGPTKGSSLVTKQIDGEGKVSYFKYDGLDRQIRAIHKQTDTVDLIDVDDAVTTSTYDPESNLISVTEPNGNTVTMEYDDINRMIEQTNAAGDISLSSYDGVSNVVTTTAANGNVSTNTYDVLDRLTQIEDSIGLVATFSYDAVGNSLTENDGNGNGISKDYDVIYRLIKVTDALGESTNLTYDAVGNLITASDRENNVTSYAYDSINRRTTITDAVGGVTQFDYDGVGNQTKITDAEGNVTEYLFDDINRLTKETYADGGILSFTYDCVGNLLSRTDQKGQVTNYGYSDLYFLLSRDYPLSVDDSFSYDLSGRMLTAIRGAWLVTFDYDGANRVTQTSQNGQVIEFAYDIPGRTRTLTYPGGRVIQESTDPRSRLNAINDAGSPPPIASYSYDLGNRVVDRSYRNGLVANYSYNANNWLTQLTHMDGVSQIAGFAHSYDKEGNKSFENRLHQTIRSEAYQYDDVYRLVDYKVGSLVGTIVPVPSTQTQYDLDLVGNWDIKTTDAIAENRTHSATNEITQIGAIPIIHNDNGNTSEDEGFEYGYDEENRLTDITRRSDNRLVGQYQYDALSRRVLKISDPFVVSNPVETRYYCDDARVIEEQDNLANTEATYVYGNYIDEVLTMDRVGSTFYYQHNSLWSVIAITDSGANIVEQYAYDAYGLVSITDSANVALPLNNWGTPHSAIDNPYLFTGRRLDESSGLYYYRARFYDTEKGRFLQRDALGYMEGMNLYIYVQNNPLKWVDPFGYNGKPPLGQAPTAAQRAQAENLYPNLVWGEWSVTGPKDKKYNCIAWTCGVINDWIWNQVDTAGDNDGLVEVSDFDVFYKKKGYKISKNCDPECKKRKIALFVKKVPAWKRVNNRWIRVMIEVPTHAARETADGGWWESKRGQNIRIMHRLKQLEGGFYGNVKKCYEKTDETANLALCPKCPPKKKAKSEN